MAVDHQHACLSWTSCLTAVTMRQFSCRKMSLSESPFRVRVRVNSSLFTVEEAWKAHFQVHDFILGYGGLL